MSAMPQVEQPLPWLLAREGEIAFRVSAARAAQREWAKVSIDERARRLHKAGDALIARARFTCAARE